jgi:hypothetical protein
MPINNLSATANAHSSIKVKDEYEAKHEAGVAGKMASVRSLSIFAIVLQTCAMMRIVFNFSIVTSVFLLLPQMVTIDNQNWNIPGVGIEDGSA